jgi:hypothetical protein
VSAYVVSKAHVDALVTAGLAMPGRHAPLAWVWPEITPEEVRYAEQRCALGVYQQRRHVLTMRTAGRVGAMLWAENQRSVNHHYDEDDWERPFEFRRLPGNLLDARIPVVVLKAVDCYEYQSCEHPAWERSEAKAFCDALRAVAIARLPGYDDAPAWEIDDPDVFVNLAPATDRG